MSEPNYGYLGAYVSPANAASYGAPLTVGQYVYEVAAGNVSPLPPPGVPTSLAGTAGDQQVALTWTAPAANSGPEVIGYAVQYSDDSGATWADSADSATTSATVTGLTNGTAYVFRVAAYNAVAYGDWTAASSSVTPTTYYMLTEDGDFLQTEDGDNLVYS